MGLELKYIKDQNLDFLQNVDWQDLKVLTDLLIKDCEGMDHWTGELKRRIEDENLEDEAVFYKENWRAIAAELQLFGGNTITNTWRRQGVQYEEVLHASAKRVGVDFYQDISIEKLEERLLMKLFGRITDMDDLESINKTLKMKGLLGIPSLRKEPVNTILSSVSNQSAGAIALMAATKLFSLPVAATAGVISMASPAYRVTVPCVCVIAMMRIKHTENQGVATETKPKTKAKPTAKAKPKAEPKPKAKAKPKAK